MQCPFQREISKTKKYFTKSQIGPQPTNAVNHLEAINIQFIDTLLNITHHLLLKHIDTHRHRNLLPPTY